MFSFSTVLGDLFIDERLVAESAERQIYYAVDRVLKRPVSVRVHLAPQLPGRAWFVRETEVLASLDHPSIRHIYSAGQRGDVAYRVGNWVDGESLADACLRGPRPIPLVLGLARDLLYAMDHAHVRNVVMRRVKPTTLMVDRWNRGIVTDLRFASAVLDAVPPALRAEDDPFLAPEVRGGEPGDPGADIYALGALLYFAFTGQAPDSSPQPLRALRSATPAAVEHIVMRAIARRPADRYLTAAEMLDELTSFVGEFNEPGAGPNMILPDTPGWEKRLRRALGDDYELLAEIGSGSFGRVYRVRDLHLEREVALKVLDPRLTQDPAIAEGFRREAQLAAGLQHPNIVRIYDIDARLGLLWYTMEVIRGQSVAQLVDREGQLSVPRVIEILDDGLNALEFAHARRLVHRDIKPENLLVDLTGRVHVTDFGLALALPRGRIFGGATSRSGTPQYAAPEQLGGGQVDARSDLFSLAAVGYFLLLGRPPFPERGPENAWRGDVRFTIPDVSKERRDVPPELAAVLRRACSWEPSDRFDDCRSFREAIEAAGFVTGERRLPADDGLLERLKRLF
jgi:serine/threonine protein kinase